MTDCAKLDPTLRVAYRAYQEGTRASDAGVPTAGITVSLTHEGPLAPIEALGFRTVSAGMGKSTGVIMFADLPAICDSPEVLWLAAGKPREPSLDTAVPDIRARASAAAKVGAGGDGVWFLNTGTSALNSAPNGTGAGVIVAIIDTGIDYTHPMFLKQTTPTKQTRVLCIWDQGLTPATLADCPDKALLEGETYGIEFTDAKINASLASGKALGHLDCVGHGTHCAGIAAGGKLDGGKLVGVAPEADIIAVKLLDTPPTLHFFSGPAGVEVGFTQRFHDAVLYCLRTARKLGKPIVLSMSFGNSSEAGDALDDDAIWVDALMNPAAAADAMHFPKGAVIVKAAGNDGDATRRPVARITVPASGKVVLPAVLNDSRVGTDNKRVRCAEGVFSPTIGFDIWYRRTTPPGAVKFAFRYPDAAAFGSDFTVGQSLDQAFELTVGPPRSTRIVTGSGAHNRMFLAHDDDPAVPHPSGGTVRRQHFSINVAPKVVSGTVTYYAGTYEVRITAPPGTVLFLMCEGQGWSAGKFVRFEVGTQLRDGTAIDPAVIDVTSEFSATDTLGTNVITVAAYDDTDGNAADPKHGSIATFSSRGPLRDFSDPPGSKPLVATKPDIAAPGVKINSARTANDGEFLSALERIVTGTGHKELKGTSMAAPMIAGVIALLLNKKPALNINDLRALKTRPGASPSASPAAERAYGRGMIDTVATFIAIP